MQSNPHGLPMPPTPTAFLIVAVVACLWAVGLFAAGFVIAAAVVGAVAVVCALLGVAKRKQASRLG